ncbi:hypothetical protein LPJ72_003630 [Coemansia sp. Benny D160-2]|nr:hypothetical protein LPJ72_003630 [Coemansia sp. Benny D160-2]
MTTPLFSHHSRNSGGGGSGSGGHQRKLVAGSLAEFRAGRMYRDGDTNWVLPDNRRGVCYVKKEEEDGLLRFVWKEKKPAGGGAAAAEVEELIVFPGDVRLERVKQSSGRVYVLRFQTSDKRLFVWMQGGDAARDEADVREMNLVLNGGDEEEEEEEEEELDEEEDEEDEEDEAEAVEEMDANDDEAGAERSQLLRRRASSREAEALSHQREQSALARESPALGGAASLSSAQVGGVPGSSMRSMSTRAPGADVVAPFSSSDLDSLRDLLLMRTQGAGGRTRMQTRSRGTPQPASASSAAGQLRLGDVLTPDNLVSVLSDEKLRAALFPTLPDSMPHTRESLDQTVRSPQFRQALDALTYVLESGQMAPLVSQLGLDPQASTSVEAFLRAVAKKVEQDGGDGDDQDAEMQG